MGIVLLFALYIRVDNVSMLINFDLVKDISVGPDSTEYLDFADNIFNKTKYSDLSTKSKHIMLIRPPGYPLFLSTFRYVSKGLDKILWAQAIMSSVIPAGIFFFMWIITRSVKWSLLGGVLGVISPAGVWETGEIMADLPLAFLFLLGNVFLYLSIRWEKNHYCVIAALLFSYASLVKPVMLLWPVYSLIVIYLYLKSCDKKICKYTIISFVIIQFIIICSWSYRNYYKEQVYSLSTIGIQTIHQYLISQVDSCDNIECDNMNSLSSGYKIYYGKKNKQLKLKYDLYNNKKIKNIVDMQKKESIKSILSNPKATIYYIYKNMIYNSQAPIYLNKKLYKLKNKKLQYTNKIMILIFFGKYLKQIYYLVVLFFLVISPFIIFKSENVNIKRNIYFIYSNVFIICYFSFLSSMTWGTGARIVLPSEFSLIICFVLSLYVFKEVFLIAFVNTRFLGKSGN